MACYYPLTGYWSASRNKNGRRSIVFRKQDAFTDMPIEVPCGRCTGCRLEKAQEWAVRITHEAQFNLQNMFLTLTYANECLPVGETLVLEHVQKFVKRLRQYVYRKTGKTIKTFYCGEYGDLNLRPHYHLIVFNYDFDDKVLWEIKNGNRTYISESLSKLWKEGFSTIGNVEFESAGYVARYTMKKINGKNKDEHYGGRLPEFANMSNGIGRDWFNAYYREIYPSDYVIIKGRKIKVPSFYDNLLQETDPELYRKVKAKRVREIAKRKEDNGSRRTRDKEIVKKSQISTLKRN